LTRGHCCRRFDHATGFHRAWRWRYRMGAESGFVSSRSAQPAPIAWSGRYAIRTVSPGYRSQGLLMASMPERGTLRDVESDRPKPRGEARSLRTSTRPTVVVAMTSAPIRPTNMSRKAVMTTYSWLSPWFGSRRLRAVQPSNYEPLGTRS